MWFHLINSLFLAPSSFWGLVGGISILSKFTWEKDDFKEKDEKGY